MIDMQSHKVLGDKDGVLNTVPINRVTEIPGRRYHLRTTGQIARLSRSHTHAMLNEKKKKASFIASKVSKIPPEYTLHRIVGHREYS